VCGWGGGGELQLESGRRCCDMRVGLSVKRSSTAATAAAPPLHYAAHVRARRRQDIAVAAGSEPVTAAGVRSPTGAGGEGR
jgi:hypothetical protein